ncbi:hypothetical protein M513_12661 [Trichuris suis]|uniref:Uncharacterized protein n=1 Tax=Trichuris suis TaxID=68888 RepID=A0A085LNB4_9BILA|nr:hypothetical protein M513_12661 [Trichuris suis]
MQQPPSGKAKTAGDGNCRCGLSGLNPAAAEAVAFGHKLTIKIRAPNEYDYACCYGQKISALIVDA